MTDPMTDPIDGTVDGDEPADDGFDPDVDDLSAPDDGPTGAGSDGVSTIGVPARKTWDAGDRPVAWQGHVYGLVVHTTGSGLPAKAREQGVYHTVQAVNHYSTSHGCHYVNGWLGADGGDLLQVANEREQAAGVGVTNAAEPDKDQRRSIDAGRFEADLPEVLVRLWRERWPDATDSLDLLPGTRTANSCYVHVECVPCVFHTDDGLITGDDVEPLRPGLRFTRAQHDTVAALAVDVARRNGWPADEAWWRTPRLLGHEDLTPISRHDRNGGWDPGFLREEPYFDWDHVYDAIERLWNDEPDAGGEPSIIDTLTDLGRGFLDLIATGRERAAVLDAHAQGVTDPDQLTNLVFFARHPEMDGRRIEADETDLAQEWIDIRDSVVLPALVDPIVN